MNWVEGMRNAISYIEENLTEDLSVDDAAREAYISSFYFQKAFSMLCGFTVGEYVRRRRLALAAVELVSTKEKIIDIAIKYGYDSPDSFTKAFTRFHGATPIAVRKYGALAKSFAPLKIKFTLEGGYIMDYKIVEKEAFTVMGASRMFSYENAHCDIPKFWGEHYSNGGADKVCGMFGVCIDDGMGTNAFEYLIADAYNPAVEIPDGFKAVTIPKHTWAVFPCIGPMPDALQSVNGKIYSEWLPNCKEYEVAASCNIEMYTDVKDYENGNSNKNYYSEIWIPVKKK